MSDDGQNLNQNIDENAEQAANEALENSSVQDLNIPNLSDVEYATPSAYIDPDLPAYNPNQEEPEEEVKEEPEEEDILSMTPEQIEEYLKNVHAVMSKVAEKIANSKNILVAMSSDPSVDELSAAICLSLFLDRLGKHAIAIYSGTIPKALEFLNPTELFENNADVLQDFVISLNKDKADHLRYKLDGDFAKVFITPYRDRIAAEDLEFSYGDYNVDLVLALNVNNGVDLDPALREYGTIMRDASVVNITTGNPGKFGEIEWNNKRASSVSEMISDLLLNASGDVTLNPEEATALLTGIVASTDRFAHSNTFSTTMQIGSRLIEFGANPQLVAENITDDVDNKFFTFSDLKTKDESSENLNDVDTPSFSFKPTEEISDGIDPNDTTALKISHGDEELNSKEFSTEKSKEDEEAKEPESSEEKPSEEKPEESTSKESTEESTENEENSMLDELKATEASLSNVGAETAPVTEPAPVQLDAPSLDNTTPNTTPITNFATPSEDFAGVTNKYSQMLEDALNEPATPASSTPMESTLPPAEPVVNPAASVAPEITNTPEISAMPEINYGQNDGAVLPPPPTPPVSVDSSMPIPNIPTEPTAPEVTPAAPTPTPPTNQPSAPDAFTIPGI